MRLSVIVPFYNEEDGIAALAGKLSALADEIAGQYELECVLVDDGSQDGSEREVHKWFATMPNLVFVKHPQNRGLGAAMRTGFANATGQVIAAIDSDCTYDPMQIPRLLETQDRAGADVATASPYHPLGHVQNVVGWRLFLSRGASWMYRRICRNKLYTYTSMMRTYRRAVIDNVGFESDGFAGVTEILLRASEQGYRIVEVPMELRSRVTGISKMRVMRSMRMHLGLMTRAFLWRFKSPAPIAATKLKQVG